MNKQLLKMIKDEIESSGNILSVCDYGCGSGELLSNFAREFKSLSFTGIDKFSKFRSFDKEKVEKRVTLIDRDHPDFERLSLEPKFDLIFATFSLHHLQYPMKELSTILSFLKSGGKLYIIDLEFKHDTSATYVKDFSSGIEDFSKAMRGMYHRRHYTLEEAEDLFHPLSVDIARSGSFELKGDENEYQEDLEFASKVIDKKIKFLEKNGSDIEKESLIPLLELEKRLISKYEVDFKNIFELLVEKR